MQTLMAAALYFAIVFAAGMLLGAIRVSLVVPKLGETLAVLCESPFLLAVMVWAARWVPYTIALENGIPSLLLMGVVALGLQQLADVLVGIGLRGITIERHLAYFASKAGRIYAALLILFVIMPFTVNRLAQ